jgi:hypothetical protein
VQACRFVGHDARVIALKMDAPMLRSASIICRLGKSIRKTTLIKCRFPDAAEPCALQKS